MPFKVQWSPNEEQMATIYKYVKMGKKGSKKIFAAFFHQNIT